MSDKGRRALGHNINYNQDDNQLQKEFSNRPRAIPITTTSFVARRIHHTHFKNFLPCQDGVV
jgi:hypothetical protein